MFASRFLGSPQVITHLSMGFFLSVWASHASAVFQFSHSSPKILDCPHFHAFLHVSTDFPTFTCISPHFGTYSLVLPCGIMFHWCSQFPLISLFPGIFPFPAAFHQFPTFSFISIRLHHVHSFVLCIWRWKITFWTESVGILSAQYAHSPRIQRPIPLV